MDLPSPRPRLLLLRLRSPPRHILFMRLLSVRLLPGTLGRSGVDGRIRHELGQVDSHGHEQRQEEGAAFLLGQIAVVVRLRAGIEQGGCKSQRQASKNTDT